MTVVLRPRVPSVLMLTLVAVSFSAGCKGKAAGSAAAPSETAVAADTAQAQAAEAPLASVDELVAPIALYPDQLLGQILTISTTPQEVLDVGNWILANQSLEGDALTGAAKTAGFTPSAQYLVLFPQVVDNMCQELDWTTQLGEAFTSNQQSVMDAVQRKRQQAQSVGNLVSSPQMAVATKQADNGSSYIEIAPADPKVVYVPAYNPVTIYTTAPPATTTVVATEQKSGVSTGAAVGIGLLSFGVGMAVGSAINNNNDYYPYPSYGYGSMYYGGRPYYPPPYRPPVYPGYRPVYGYNPPPNYRYNNRNTNVTINNNDYYNRFNNNNRPNGNNNRPGNNNNRPGNNGNLANNNNRPGNNNNLGNNNNRPGNDNRPGNNNNGPGNNGNLANNNNRPGNNDGRPGNNANRPGAAGGAVKGTYDGARPKTGDQRPGAGMANANPNGPGGKGPGNQMASRDNPRPTPGAAGNAARPGGAATQPGTRDVNRPTGGGAAGGNRPSAGAQPVDRGYGDARPATGAAKTRPSTGAANASRPGASAPANRPAAAPKPQSRPAPQAQSRPAPQKQGGAYGGGGGGGGNSARAASSRGKSSMGGGGGGGASARGAGRAR